MFTNIIFGECKSENTSCSSHLIYQGKYIDVNKGQSSVFDSKQKLYHVKLNIEEIRCSSITFWEGCEEYTFIDNWLMKKESNSIQFILDDIDYEKRILSWIFDKIIHTDSLYNIIGYIIEEAMEEGYSNALADVRKNLRV